MTLPAKTGEAPVASSPSVLRSPLLALFKVHASALLAMRSQKSGHDPWHIVPDPVQFGSEQPKVYLHYAMFSDYNDTKLFKRSEDWMGHEDGVSFLALSMGGSWWTMQVHHESAFPVSSREDYGRLMQGAVSTGPNALRVTLHQWDTPLLAAEFMEHKWSKELSIADQVKNAVPELQREAMVLREEALREAAVPGHRPPAIKV